MNVARFLRSLLLVATLLPAAAHANFVGIDTDFESHPLTFIQFRGPAFGEPTPGPFDALDPRVVFTSGDQKLIIQDDAATAQVTHWTMLHDNVATDGLLYLSCNVQFDTIEDYVVQVSGADFIQDLFVGVQFDSNGNIFRYDGDSGFVLLGNYFAGGEYSIEIVMDLDAETYTLLLNGLVRVSNESWGVASGVVELTVGNSQDADLVGALRVDDIFIYHQPASGDVLLQADFDNQPVNQVINTGGALQGQPVSIAGTPTVRDNNAFPTPSLELCDRNNPVENARFQFRDNEFVTQGSVSISFDLNFTHFDVYTAEILAGSTPRLLLLFREDGTIWFRDTVSGATPYYIDDYFERIPMNVRVCLIPDLDLIYVWIDLQLVVMRRDIGAANVNILEFNAADTSGDGTCMYVDNLTVLRLENPATSVELPALSRPAILHPAVPNPFNPATDLRFSLSNPGRVRLQILDVRGRLVDTLVDGMWAAGDHRVRWDGRDDQGRSVASGVYHAQLEQDGATDLEKLVLVK